MDNFDNFQYDSASSYGGGIGVVDDNSSVYTANTQEDNQSSVDISSLSITEPSIANGQVQVEDFDAGIDGDEGAVDLPAHACR